MTPQENEMLATLLDRLKRAPAPAMDRKAESMIGQAVAARPDEAIATADVRTDHVPSVDSTAQQREQRLERLVDRLPRRLQPAVRWLRHPSSRWVRVPAGVLLIAGGLLSILPLLGIWMLPLGLILLAEDIAPLRRTRDRFLDWIERRHPHWMKR